MRRLALACAFVSTLAACGGPKAPLVVGVKSYPTDVTFGARSVTAPISSVESGVPIVVHRSTVRLETEPPAAAVSPAPPCPSAPPLAVPAKEATDHADLPPAAHTYMFRTNGSVEVSGAKFPLPSLVARTIANVKHSGATYTYDILAGATTTSWLLDPAAGVSMVAQRTRMPDGTVDAFVPNPPIKFLAFPAQPGASWDSAGVDVSSHRTMVLHGAVGAVIADPRNPKAPPAFQSRIRVDACGSLVDAWVVKISGPHDQGGARIVGPTQNTELKGIYAFAPQYGAFSVMDKVDLSGTAGTATVHSSATSVISALPAPSKP